jgi:hypothetical protein
LSNLQKLEKATFGSMGTGFGIRERDNIFGCRVNGPENVRVNVGHPAIGSKREEDGNMLKDIGTDVNTDRCL